MKSYPKCGCGLMMMVDYNGISFLCQVCDRHDDCSKYVNCTGTKQKVCAMRKALEDA